MPFPPPRYRGAGVSHPPDPHHDGAVLQPLTAEVLALLVYGPLVIVVHELGHALLARAGGFRVIHFALGHGPPLLRLGTVGGARIWIGRWVLSGGQCSAIPLGPVQPRGAWFHAGGLFAQGVLAIVLALAPGGWWIERAALFNGVVALTNALPWRVRGSASDGWYLLDLWRGGRTQAEILPQRRALLRMREHERRVGSPLGTAWATLCLAWGDAVAGSTTVPPTIDNPALGGEPYLVALSTYVRAEHLRRQGRPMEALTVADEADKPAALVGLVRAATLLDLGQTDAARSALIDLLGGPEPVVRQALVHRLRAALADEPDEVEAATWRVIRQHHRAWLDPIEAANTLAAAARHLEAHGRIQAAEGTREAARVLAARTLSNCHPDDVPAVQRRLDLT